MLDLTRVFEGALFLPWGGVEWRIEEPSAKWAEDVRSRLIFMDAEQEIAAIQQLMGHDQDDPSYTPEMDVWQSLVDAGIGWPSLMFMGRTALLYATTNYEVADSYWKAGQLGQLMVDLVEMEEEVEDGTGPG